MILILVALLCIGVIRLFDKDACVGDKLRLVWITRAPGIKLRVVCTELREAWEHWKDLRDFGLDIVYIHPCLMSQAKLDDLEEFDGL